MTVIKEENYQKTLHCIDLEDVDFIESEGSRIKYVIGDEEYYHVSGMEEMDELLSEQGYVSLDHSNLVNLLKIRSFDRENGKVYFTETPYSSSRFARVAKIKYKMVSILIQRFISIHNGTTVEIKKEKKPLSIQSIFRSIKP
jgi:hypothetical protein